MSAGGAGPEGDGLAAYDGASPLELAARLGVPRVASFDVVGSTLDVAHQLAASGAPAGTLVIADAQSAGRGRGGKRWQSDLGAGIWLTLVERPTDSHAIAVLSLRLGLHAAWALEPFAGGDILLKWPNDLFIKGQKLAGILVEARWREGRPDWVAIGFGLNVRRPAGREAAALRDDTSRLDVLAALVPALRRAGARRGVLTEEELASFRDRDLARGRRCLAPIEGRVDGITAGGELIVTTVAGVEHARGGSLLIDGLDA